MFFIFFTIYGKMSGRYVKVVFWDHACYSEIDLEHKEVSALGGVLTVVVGKIVHENEECILVTPWIAEGANSDVYAILKANIISLEELIPKSQVRKVGRRRK